MKTGFNRADRNSSRVEDLRKLERGGKKASDTPNLEKKKKNISKSRRVMKFLAR